MEDIIDITDDIAEGEGFPSTDRVYSYEGKFYKVRLENVPAPPGSQNMGIAFFRASGAETDSSGWALTRPEGYRIAQPQVRTVMSDMTVDLVALLNTIRHEIVVSTARASALQDQLESFQ